MVEFQVFKEHSEFFHGNLLQVQHAIENNVYKTLKYLLCII